MLLMLPTMLANQPGPKAFGMSRLISQMGVFCQTHNLLMFFNTSIFAKSMLFLRLGTVQSIFNAAKRKVRKVIYIVYEHLQWADNPM